MRVHSVCYSGAQLQPEEQISVEQQFPGHNLELGEACSPGLRKKLNEYAVATQWGESPAWDATAHVTSSYGSNSTYNRARVLAVRSVMVDAKGFCGAIMSFQLVPGSGTIRDILVTGRLTDDALKWRDIPEEWLVNSHLPW